MLIGVVALIVVGPQRLPGMMATVGKWSNKLRRMLFDVRQQSGIDDILRAEGITGGLNEIRALRNAVRGNVSSLTQALTSVPKPAAPNLSSPAAGANAGVPSAVSPGPLAQTALAAESDPYANIPYDRSREYPDEGCDAYGAIPDDLWTASQRPHTVAPEPEPEPVEANLTALEVAASTAALATTEGESEAPATTSEANTATAATAASDAEEPGVAASATAIDAAPSADEPSADVATAIDAAPNPDEPSADVATPPDATSLETAATAQPTSPSLTASSAS